MAKRLYVEGNGVFYRSELLCRVFGTSLCDRYEAAEMIAALFNRWLNKQEAIHEELARSDREDEREE